MIGTGNLGFIVHQNPSPSDRKAWQDGARLGIRLSGPRILRSLARFVVCVKGQQLHSCKTQLVFASND